MLPTGEAGHKRKHNHTVAAEVDGLSEHASLQQRQFKLPSPTEPLDIRGAGDARLSRFVNRRFELRQPSSDLAYPLADLHGDVVSDPDREQSQGEVA